MTRAPKAPWSHRFAAAPFAAALLVTVALVPAVAVAQRVDVAGVERPDGEAPTVAPADLRPYAPGTPQLGAGGTPQRPARAILRQDEDWSWLAGVPLHERSTLDGLKYIPLTIDGSMFLTFAADARGRIEHFDDASFGDRPGEETTLHSFVNPHVGLTIGDRLRLYGALKYGSVSNERFQASPVDEQAWDVHQAFAEISFGDLIGLPTRDAFVRVGRQELHYGAGRLVTIRGGPNVRRDFDGATARLRVGPTVGEALWFQPTEEDKGSFDNGTNHGQAIWGLYTSTALQPFAAPDTLLARGHLDLYYFGQRRDESAYAFLPRPVEERRHTIGARFWTGGPPTDGLNLDLEAVAQFGDVDGLNGGDGSILAGLVTGVATYGVDLAWSPVLELRTGISTGDRDPNDDRIGTYRPLYPSGRYFGDANEFGPGNIAAISPAITVTPIEGLSFTARSETFWRVSDTDGVYAVAQRPVRMGAGTRNYLGTEFSLTAEYAVNEYVSVDAVLSHLNTSSFFDANPPGRDTTYARINLGVSF